jgi:hypothetical protein
MSLMLQNTAEDMANVINNIQQMWYKKELFILKHSSQTFPITLYS